MTERPALFVLGDAVEQWAEQWRGDGPADLAAAMVEGIGLCDAVIGRATPLLANAAIRSPSPKHLLLLRAILATWRLGVSGLRKRHPVTRGSTDLVAAVGRADAMTRALVVAEAAATAKRPPEPVRTSVTQQEAQDAIRVRRAMDG